MGAWWVGAATTMGMGLGQAVVVVAGLWVSPVALGCRIRPFITGVMP